MMTMRQKTLKRVMTDPDVDTTLTMVATVVGLSKKTVTKIVECGLPVMADVADSDPWVFKAMFAQSRKPVPQPSPEFYATLNKDATSKQMMAADFEAIFGQKTETIHRDAAIHAAVTEEQVSQVLAATMPAVVIALGKASTHPNEMGFGRQLRNLHA